LEEEILTEAATLNASLQYSKPAMGETISATSELRRSSMENQNTTNEGLKPNLSIVNGFYKRNECGNDTEEAGKILGER